MNEYTMTMKISNNFNAPYFYLRKAIIENDKAMLFFSNNIDLAKMFEYDVVANIMDIIEYLGPAKVEFYNDKHKVDTSVTTIIVSISITNMDHNKKG